MSAPHPVESSQQSVQLPALDAPHAAIAQTPAQDGAPAEAKPKKEKAKAATSAYPLEARPRLRSPAPAR
jgi:hypothetical protein